MHADQMLRIASAHKMAACFDAGSNPPTASSTIAAEIDLNSARDFPSINSVNADPAAIDAVHPRT
jgi:hypothetical protein